MKGLVPSWYERLGLSWTSFGWLRMQKGGTWKHASSKSLATEMCVRARMRMRRKSNDARYKLKARQECAGRTYWNWQGVQRTSSVMYCAWKNWKEKQKQTTCQQSTKRWQEWRHTQHSIMGAAAGAVSGERCREGRGRDRLETGVMV